MAGGTPRRVVYRDDSLPHQIRLFMVGQDIAVSCTCLRKMVRSPKAMSRGPASFAPIEMRTRWESGEAVRAHREWHLRKLGLPWSASYGPQAYRELARVQQEEGK
jgi:hypothetical protein